jgi:glycosyltransferase involved in cell wall biosynthesis
MQLFYKFIAGDNIICRLTNWFTRYLQIEGSTPVPSKVVMRAAFVGHFTPLSLALEHASSAAGNQVQRQIFKELSQQYGIEGAICFAMTPSPAWPRGPFISRSHTEGSNAFIGYLNLPVLKHIVFALRLLARLMIFRPQLCLQYNSYLFENFALLLYRWICRDSALAIIIQDVHVAVGKSLLSRAGLRSHSEHISLRFAKRFDMTVPISSAIITDFHLEPSKCMVFQGGITDFAVQVMSGQAQALMDVGVFAGGLELHNGIDRLVDQWLGGGIQQQLHVFGRGSLDRHVEQAALKSDRIIFHGFQPEHVVLAWQLKARWNFCLRYSRGLNQTYFFPSKFFNILCAPGAVVVNDFHALPDTVRDYLCVVSDDLSNLAEHLSAAASLSSPDCVRARREIVRLKHSWHSCIGEIVHTLRPNPNE